MHQFVILAAERLSQKLRKSTATDQKQFLATFIHRIDVHPGKIVISVDGSQLLAALAEGTSFAPGIKSKPQGIRQITFAHAIRRRGVEVKLVLATDADSKPRPDRLLIMAIAKAHLWFNELTSGRAASIDQLARNLGEDRNEVSRFLSLAHLAPDIVEKILAGRQPVELTLERIRRLLPLSSSWREQRETLGFAG